MSLFKRGNVYHYDIDGIRRSTGQTDPDKAQIVHDLRAKQIAAGQRDCVTFDSAMSEHLLDRKDGSNVEMDTIYAKWWTARFTGRELHDITEREIELAGEEKRKETTASTANHYLAFLKTFFNICSSKGTKYVRGKRWLLEVPDIRMYKVDNAVCRALSIEEYEALLAELPPHLKVMVEFSVETGLRQQNVTQLKWEKVDLRRGTLTVDAAKFKNRSRFDCLLTPRALELLKAQVGKHPEFVFVYEKYSKASGIQAVPVTRVNNHAWANALDRAGVKDFRWHDLRHTFASNHAANGTPLMVLKALGGWKTMQMVGRYANIAAEGQRQFLGNAGFRRPDSATGPSD
jgi:integrase